MLFKKIGFAAETDIDGSGSLLEWAATVGPLGSLVSGEQGLLSTYNTQINVVV